MAFVSLVLDLLVFPFEIRNIPCSLHHGGILFQRRRENLFLPDPEAIKSLLLNSGSTYSEIMQRLVRRYLFKLERDDENAGKLLRVCKITFNNGPNTRTNVLKSVMDLL